MNKSNEDGFTLVEAIVALAVSAIAAAGLMSALGSAAVRSAEVGIRDQALRQARLLLAEALAAPKTTTLPLKGALPEAGLTWVVSSGKPGDPYPDIQKVEVEVRWKAARKEGATRLEAYRLVPT